MQIRLLRCEGGTVHANVYSSRFSYSVIFSTLPTILPSTKGRGASSSEYSSSSSILTSGQKYLKKNLEREHKQKMKKRFKWQC